MNGYTPGALEQDQEKEDDFAGISSVDVFSLAPFPSRQQDVFLQAPFGPRKNVSVLQPFTVNYETSSEGQQTITAPCVNSQAATGHQAVSAVRQQTVKVPQVTSNVRQEPITAQHVLPGGNPQPRDTAHRVLSSVGQQPITAHRVVSSVGQQAAVGSVSVGPLYSWTLDVRTTFQPKCHQEKP